MALLEIHSYLLIQSSAKDNSTRLQKFLMLLDLLLKLMIFFLLLLPFYSLFLLSKPLTVCDTVQDYDHEQI